MCDLIFDIITCCVRSCDMGKISVYDKIVIENHQKIEIWRSKKYYINLHLKDRLQMEFTAC